MVTNKLFFVKKKCRRVSGVNVKRTTKQIMSKYAHLSSFHSLLAE